MNPTTWKEKLAGRIPEDWGREIDSFEAQMALRKAGKIEEKVFAETRLRRGTYGQRYDNGRRHDGVKTQDLSYAPLTKGPDTVWDAPGMQRIKIPFGGVNPEQMVVLAELAEEYSDQICHITTRQDFQLHFVHIEDVPQVFRRLAAVGITTREACGNSVRNVTACPLAGVCRTETFDVTPYSKAVAFYLLGHPDTQDFGRKFKIAFSGCEHEACGLVSIHDLGGIAKVRPGPDGRPLRGFALYVGGGLGAVPHQAKLYEEFLPEEDLLPLARAIGRVFARMGEKRNRNRARLKFLVQKLGIDEFRRIVQEEVRTMPEDPSWRKHFDQIPRFEEKPAWKGVQLNGARRPEGFDEWAKTNVYEQRQTGYAVATVTCPLGDLTSDQMRALADISRRYAGGNARTTVEQNLVLRWVPQDKLIDLYNELKPSAWGRARRRHDRRRHRLPRHGHLQAGHLLQPRPGWRAARAAGRASRRTRRGDPRPADQGLRLLQLLRPAPRRRHRLLRQQPQRRRVHRPALPGDARRAVERERRVYGLAMGAVPSKRVPELVNALTDRYTAGSRTARLSSSGASGSARRSSRQSSTRSSPFRRTPPTRRSTTTGATRGSTPSATWASASARAKSSRSPSSVSPRPRAWRSRPSSCSMPATSARQTTWPTARCSGRPGPSFRPSGSTRRRIRAWSSDEFRKRFVDTKIFWDTYHADQFSRYLFVRHEGPDARYTKETAHKLIEEANLFIDAAHKAHAKVQASMNVLAPQPA